jgi:hypothetical protein
VLRAAGVARTLIFEGGRWRWWVVPVVVAVAAVVVLVAAVVVVVVVVVAAVVVVVVVVASKQPLPTKQVYACFCRRGLVVLVKATSSYKNEHICSFSWEEIGGGGQDNLLLQKRARMLIFVGGG